MENEKTISKEEKKKQKEEKKKHDKKLKNEELKQKDDKQEIDTLDDKGENEEKETNTKDKKEEQKKPKKKLSKKAKTIIITILAVIILTALSVAAFLIFRPKFKDATIELGTTEISVDNFLVSDMYKENSAIVTPVEQIDFSKVADIDVTLKHKDKEQTVKLHIVDTTPPTVTFQDITRYTDYVVNPDDFIVEKSDLSEMTTEATQLDNTSEYKDYTVTVTVKDAYGNATSKDCILTINWLKHEEYAELGQPFSKENVIVNMEKDADKLPQSEIDKVDTSKIGEYTLSATVGGVEYTCKVTVRDTTPPDLELKDVSIYVGDKVKGKDSFIQSVADASGEVTTTMKTEIDYSKVGTQDIVIEAVDINNNKTEKTCKLTIREDTDGPKFSGVGNLSVRKNATIDYYSGVTATDAREGKKDFTVDSSNVDTSKAGTYYATYKSSDSKGNTTTYKRKITVAHDSSDVNALVKQMAAQCGSGVEQIRDFVRNKIKYGHSYGDGDPVWYGFTNWSGNCYVHALCFQALLREKGYETMLIWTTDKTHYWNLVKINGSWKHMDSTPDRNHRKISIMNDEQRLSTLSGRTWDRSAFPSAN